MNPLIDYYPKSNRTAHRQLWVTSRHCVIRSFREDYSLKMFGLEERKSRL